MIQPSTLQIQEWADALLHGTIGAEDKRLFLDWYRQLPDTELLWPEDHIAGREALRLSILDGIRRDIIREEGNRNFPSTPRRKAPLVRYAVAASLAGLLGVGGYWLATRYSDRAATPASNLSARADLAPGHTGAVLTLDDGSAIVLDSAANGRLVSQGNTQVIKQNGQLSYDPKNTSAIAPSTAFNTMTTPRGRQYKLVLPDGTKVWLDAASSIRFPVVFTGSGRTVELVGQGYFEIAKDAARPFYVLAAGTKVAVLGTHFNIMAYDEDQEMRTTLLEGSVRVMRDADARLLVPGQQSITAITAPLSNPGLASGVSPSANASIPRTAGPKTGIRVEQTDPEQAVAWKQGLFRFRNADIGTVMRQLSRWYDVQVEYQGTIDARFIATIPMDVTAAAAFRILEQTGGVHFAIEGRKIIVRPWSSH